MFSTLLHRGAAAVGGVALGIALLGGSALAYSGPVVSANNFSLAGKADGYFIWHNANGMHLRTTDKEGVHVYDGTLRTDGSFYDVTAVRLESGDTVNLIDEHTIRYHFVTAEGVDGFDFRVKDGDRLTFNLKQGDDEISTSEIYLGPNGVHPQTDPFAIFRPNDPSSVIATPTSGN